MARGRDYDGGQMKLLVTGGTGLLGGALLNLLLAGGHEVRCLVREKSPNASRLETGRVEVVRGDVANVRDLLRAFSGVKIMVHVAGIEYAPRVVEAARLAAVERVVVVGSTSAHSASPPSLRSCTTSDPVLCP